MQSKAKSKQGTMFQRVLVPVLQSKDLDLWLVPVQPLIRSSSSLYDVLAGGFDRWRATEACQCDSKLAERVRDSARGRGVLPSIGATASIRWQRNLPSDLSDLASHVTKTNGLSRFLLIWERIWDDVWSIFEPLEH